MNFDARSYRLRLLKALFDWLDLHTPRRGIAATLTFDPRRSTASRNKWRAQAAFRQFAARVNRRVYKRAYWRHGKRLTVIPTLEGGRESGKHLHYHALIEVPAHIDVERFRRILQKEWAGLLEGGRYQIADYVSNGWLRYLLKDRSQDDVLEVMDFRNLWLNGINLGAEASLLRDRDSQGRPKEAPLISYSLPELPVWLNENSHAIPLDSKPMRERTGNGEL